MAKKSLSLLTPASQKKLAKMMNDEDLFLLATMAGDVYKGSCTVELYRDIEKQMIEKYEFKVK